MKKSRILKKITAAVLLLAMLCSLCACSRTDKNNYPVTVQGVTVAHKPQKILVLSQQLADVVLALGGSDQVMGVGAGCAQTRWTDKTVVSAENTAVLQQQDADLILYTDELTDAAAAQLQQAGIPVIKIPGAKNRSDLERLYTDVGSVLAGQTKGAEAAQTTASNILQTLDDITRIIPHSDTLTTAGVIYDLDGHGATGDTFTHSLLTSAGLSNVLGGQSDGIYDFSILKTCDPLLLFCPTGLKDDICADPDFAELTAVKEDRLYEVDDAILYGQGRSTISLSICFAGSAFPELLEKIPTVVPDIEKGDELNTALYQTLETGDSGYSVFKMQTRLDELGYLTSSYGGEFGEVTYRCVRQFQSVNGLEVTGIADPYTQALLYSNLAQPKPAEY